MPGASVPEVKLNVMPLVNFTPVSGTGVVALMFFSSMNSYSSLRKVSPGFAPGLYITSVTRRKFCAAEGVPV